MLVVGLTGGIGSGKTTVANLFAAHGVPIIDADEVARELVLPGEPAYQSIVNHFGKSVVAKDRHLERRKLRHIIFDQPTEKIWLENLLHPLIRERIAKRLPLIKAPYCILIIPLLLETKPYPFINRVLIIDATVEQQLQRVAIRDQASSSQINAIFQTQTTREQRLAAADDIVVNKGAIEDLKPQVEKLHKAYLALAKS